jgi:hypothetical protein
MIFNMKGDYNKDKCEKLDKAICKKMRKVMGDWVNRGGELTKQTAAWDKSPSAATGAPFPSIVKLAYMFKSNIFVMYPSQAQRILVQNGPGAATREATQKLAAAADTASALQAVDRNLATAKAVPRSLQGDLGNEVREALFNTNLPKLLNRIQVCHGLYFFQFRSV